MIRTFKVGDTVYTPSHGKGTISSIDDSDGEIAASFNGIIVYFDKSGILLDLNGCTIPTLTHGPWIHPAPEWFPDYAEGDIVKIFRDGFIGTPEIAIVREHHNEWKISVYPGTVAHLLEPFSERIVELTTNTIEKIGSIHEPVPDLPTE